jgi:predicted amino acid dehydrogenase
VDTFAFIIHPLDPKRDVSRKFPLLGKIFSQSQINYLCRFFPPVYLSKVTGIRSAATGKEIMGHLIACPLTAARMLELPVKTAYHKIIQTGRLAENLGAQILGLGAFTSVVGDGGVTIAEALDIPVTTGDSFTVSVAVQAVQKAARIMGLEIGHSTAAVVGASGTIGQVCAELMADEVETIYLVGRDHRRLEALKTRLSEKAKARVLASTSLEVLATAHLIITVSSAVHTIIEPEHLMAGSIVCDVARPRDVSKNVARTRKDVLVIDGGMVDVPGDVNFNFDFGFPPGKAYACMAETMVLALDGRYHDFSVGKEIRRDQVDEITTLCQTHGFQLSGFRSFEKPVSIEQISNFRHYAYGNARKAKAITGFL